MRKSSLLNVIIALLCLAVALVVLGFYYQCYLDGRISFVNRSFVVYTFLFIILVAISLALVLTDRLLLIAEQKRLVEAQHYQNEKLWEMNQVIRTQRHDFVNHLQTVYGFIQLGMYDEAQAFVTELYTELQATGEAMRVAVPELSALLFAKSSLATHNDISLKISVDSDLSDINIRPFDLVTITGNLINNALEAVENLPPLERKVCFSIFENRRYYVIQTRNPGFIPPDRRTQVFTPGYTTKQGGDHRGLGLASIRNLSEAYHGFTVVSSHPERGTRVTVGLPKWVGRKIA
ncbi:MAG: Spo0B domain-containing protein [Syntrophomonadaceae bacterium]